MAKRKWSLPIWKQGVIYLGLMIALIAPRLYTVGTTGVETGRIQASRHEQPVMGEQARVEGKFLRDFAMVIGFGYLIVAVPLLLFVPNRKKTDG